MKMIRRDDVLDMLFPTLIARQQHCRGSSLAFLDHYQSHQHHLHTRRRCGDEHVPIVLHHRFKQHPRRSPPPPPSSSYWSLQAQQDDNTPPRKRKRRRRVKEINTDDDGNDDVVSTLLFSPFPIPFSVGSTNRKQTIASLYPLAIVAAIPFIPIITWVLLVLFFGSYLALLLPLSEEYDDIVMVSVENNEKEEEDEERMIGAPLISFVGAVASAALLSPEGLIISNQKGYDLLSLTYLFAVVVVALVGYNVLFAGVNETARDMREWEGEEIDELSVRMEMSAMNEWDDKLNDTKDSRLN